MDASSSISMSPPAPPRLPTLYPRPPSLPQQHQSLSATTANYDLDSCYPMDDDFAHAHGHGHGQTCVPSLIPPGIDPAHVDMRTFYPYQPNEVKHRKRTTRQQLRVLEDVYKRDTKPNAGLRKKLAEELGMTPRGVQVWFQNRRAKTKSQNRKAEQAISLGVPPPGGNGNNNDNNGNSDGNASANISGTHTNGKSATEPIDLTEPQASATINMDVKLDAERSRSAEKLGSVGDIQTEATTEASSAISLTVDDVPEWSPSTAATSPNTNTHSSPASPDVSVTGNNGVSSNVQSPPTISSQAFPLSSSLSPSSPYLDSQAMTHALAARRPSLPVLSFSGPGNITSPSMNGNGGVYRTPSGFDPAQRRKSIDVSRRMLGGHPYAHLAQNTNAALYPTTPSPSATWDSQSPNGNQNVSPRVSRQGVRHGSMPHVFQNAGFDAHGKEARHGQFLSPQTAARRPGFSPRLSMPSSPQPPPAMLLNRRYASFSQQSSSPPQLLATSFGVGGVGEGYEFPGQAHMQRRRRQASPGGRSPPPPIAQFSNNQGSSGASGVEMYVPARPVAEPIPGPLPDASYSFGMPATDSYASSGSQEGEREGSGSRGGSSAGSPSPTTSSATLHARAGTGSNGAGLGLGLGLAPGLGGGVRRGTGEEEGDDESLSPPGSAYAWSRNGSLASAAGSETSWTSWSEMGASSTGGTSDTKESAQEYVDGRRPSIFLPQMFSGLDVGNGSGGNGRGTNSSNSGGQNQEAGVEGATPQPSGSTESDNNSVGSALAANGEVQRRASVDVPVFEGESAWQDTYPSVPAYGAFMRHGHGLGLPHGTPAEVQNTRMGGELPLLYQKYTVPGVDEEHVSPQPPAYYTGSYAPQTASDAYGQASPPEAFTQQSTPDFAQQSPPAAFTQSPPETFAQQPTPEGFAQQASPEGYAQQTAPEGYGAMYGAYGVPLEYPAYTAWGVPVYSSGAIELDRMCVPSALTMETIGEYALYGTQ